MTEDQVAHGFPDSPAQVGERAAHAGRFTALPQPVDPASLNTGKPPVDGPLDPPGDPDAAWLLRNAGI